jgi:Tfp pilus assembly protein PilF
MSMMAPSPPQPSGALKDRYLAQRRQGDLAAAGETLKSVLHADPRADWAYNEMIELLLASGRNADAETVARTALRVNPLNAQAHNHFGTLLSELNDLPSGEWHFRRAIDLLRTGGAPLAGEQPSFLANLGLNLMQQGRTAEAEVYFARADALDPGNLKIMAHWSKTAEVQGNMPRAVELLDRAAAAAVPGQDVSLLRANHLARVGETEAALALLDAAPALNGDARLERGRLLDRLGRYDEAWDDMVAGKKLLAAERGGLTYNAQAVDGFFAGLRQFFVRANIELLPQAPIRRDVPQPIFIMGFPRSGTTLIEQVLCSHPSIRAGGELSFMTELRAFSLLQFPGPESFPGNLARTWTADHRYAATLFRDFYFARAEQYGLLGNDKAFFTDKMPFNETWLPLIRMAFPEGRIIRVSRNPLDVCVSMLANNMTHGFNCGYRIEDIVHHLLAVSSLDMHYARELDNGSHAAGYDLRYEDFVAGQRDGTLRLLDYLGLTFDAACLNFHENKRYAPTPSYAQVTQKLNDRSIGRHLNYLRQLAPFAGRLQPLLKARGYR